ncbi:single-stranded DNA-binding protein [Clostridia bacterium]|nr:single-stranded DNA-binding protein [Clostridia bacterium]
MLNHAILMGRLTRDPELRRTQNGTSVTSFSLAVDRPKPKEGESHTDFIDVVAWRTTAEFAEKYFRKGQLVAVEGRIQVRPYKDKEGNNRKAVEVVADRVHFAESKKNADNSPVTVPVPNDFVPDFGESDGELPF